MMRFTYVLALLSCMLFQGLQSFAQGAFYNTYEQFQNKTGITFDEYQGMSWVGGHVASLKFKVGGESIKIKPAQIWGFVYKDQLFRICTQDRVPVILLSTGIINYYENGLAYLQMMRDGTTTGSFSTGVYCYVSKTLESEVVLLPFNGVMDERKVKNLIAENPKLKELFECMGSQKRLTDILGRSCIKALQGFPEAGK